MLLTILQHIILSLTFIVVIHYIYLYYKDILTVPKVKDLVNKPTQQYDEIYKSMNSNEKTDNMKEELNSYFKELNNNSAKSEITNENTEINDYSFSTNTSSLQYESY